MRLVQPIATATPTAAVVDREASNTLTSVPDLLEHFIFSLMDHDLTICKVLSVLVFVLLQPLWYLFTLFLILVVVDLDPPVSISTSSLEGRDILLAITIRVRIYRLRTMSSHTIH